ncbi:hypothetical protein ESCO_001518 [Escovopsis weberi]|uniref:Late endosomal/lysosomal adaptor and MAPK and MTOR activator 1 n=1 Tax=Escovopsis weberi TaxID=150374 RepID=A0A0M8N8I9_ESCWE|nr:hypothetical protein ESCO_001518 [Escovopsis weberi]
MGLCQSCLGRRDKDVSEENEDGRLLYDDGNGMHYGSFGDSAMAGDGDTADIQRESEALQRVLAKTSNNMVDIFEIAPQDANNRSFKVPFNFAGQGDRVARYHHLVSRLGTGGASPPVGVRVDWLADDETPESYTEPVMSLRTLDGEGSTLVGTFADAAAAMK